MNDGSGYRWIDTFLGTKMHQRFTMNGVFQWGVYIYSYHNTLRWLGEFAFSYDKMNLSSMNIGCVVGCNGSIYVNLIQVLQDTYLFIALCYFPPKGSINIKGNKDNCEVETCKETEIPYCILCELYFIPKSRRSIPLMSILCASAQLMST